MDTGGRGVLGGADAYVKGPDTEAANTSSILKGLHNSCDPDSQVCREGNQSANIFQASCEDLMMSKPVITVGKIRSRVQDGSECPLVRFVLDSEA